MDHSFFQSIEASALSTFLRESESLFAFPGILILHTLGMAMLAGIGAAVSLRLLGVARGVPLGTLRPFVPFAWIGFAVNAASGVLLVIAYPTKALMNPIFYAKLVLITLSLIVLAKIDRKCLRTTESPNAAPPSARALASLSLALWMLTITAGRLLPYTYRYLFAFETR